LALNIVFLGSGAFGIPSLEALGASSHRILHVVSQPDRGAGRGKGLTPTAVSAWAMEKGLALTRAEDVNAGEHLDLLRALKPEALVVIAFGQKLSDELLAIAPGRAINLHSSLLPKYRGAAPINWAVMNNDREAGVCVIEVTKVMDGGDIFASVATEIGRSETAGELHDRLAGLGAPLLPRVLDQMASGTVERVKQDLSLVSKAPKLSRDMAWVDFVSPAEIVSARIRGLSPWPGVQVEVVEASGKVRVAATVLKCVATGSTKKHEVEDCGKVLGDRTIACGVGALELITVQPQGKKAMEAKAFANGYGLVEGARLRSVVGMPAL
jgi:methionyl-tRNA formyltransferase